MRATARHGQSKMSRFLTRRRLLSLVLATLGYAGLVLYFVVVHNPFANRNTYFVGGQGIATGSIPSTKPLIMVEWPSEMDSQGSDHINISIVLPHHQRIRANIHPNPNTEGFIVATPVPIGTPATSFASAFGPRSSVSMTATLVSAGLDVGAASNAQLPTSSGPVWDWSIAPKNPGWHVATGSIYLNDVTPANGQTRSYLLWSGDVYIHAIAVPGSVFFNLLTNSFGAVIALLGAVLAPIVGLYFRASSDKGDTSSPQSSSP